MPKSFRETIGMQPSTVDLSTSALLVIDAQREYGPDGGLTVSGVKESSKVIADTVEKYRKASAPVIFVQHNAPNGAPIFNPDAELVQNLPGLEVKDGEKLIVKHAPSSFTGTDLQETLQKLKVKQLVLTGYMAHVCVTGTARAAMELGYDTIIVQDGIGDRDIPSSDGSSTIKGEELTKTVLHELADAIGTVVQSKDIKA